MSALSESFEYVLVTSYIILLTGQQLLFYFIIKLIRLLYGLCNRSTKQSDKFTIWSKNVIETGNFLSSPQNYPFLSFCICR
jgi:hypothetical protein